MTDGGALGGMERLTESNPWAISVRLKHYNTSKTEGQIRHDYRIGDQPKYVDSARSHLNSKLAAIGTTADYKTLMLERRALTNPQRAASARAAVMTGGIITFGHRAQEAVLALSTEHQDRMYREIADAIAGRLGNHRSGFSAHRDEEAPHAHFQMPSRRAGDGKLMSEILKPSITSEIQDIAAEIAQRYDSRIARGNKKEDTKARNKTVKELHRTYAADLEKLRQKVEAEKLRAAKNERLAERARAKADSETGRASKAAENAVRYENRAAKARTALADTEAELTAMEAKLAQKKTKIASLLMRKAALQQRLQTLSAA